MPNDSIDNSFGSEPVDAGESSGSGAEPREEEAAKPAPEPKTSEIPAPRDEDPNERGLGRADLVFAVSLVFFVSIAALIQIIRGEMFPVIDNAVRNIVTGSAITLSSLLASVWFCFYSKVPWRIRTYVGIAGLLVFASLVAVVRVEEVSGDMIPRFRWAWQQPGDYGIESQRGTGAPIALDPGSLDFPAYLGPYGNGVVDTVRLDSDWSKLKPAWRQPIGAGWSGFAAVNGYAVTMEQRGDLEQIVCYDVHAGRLVWQHSLKVRHATTLGGIGPKATPTISNGRVYALGGTGVLRCLDGSTGDLLWKVDIPELVKISPEEELLQIAWGRANSPLAVDDLIVIPAGGPMDGPNHSLIAFDAETGAERWRGGDRNPSYASPIVGTIADVRQIVSVNEDNITGHAIADGSVLWEVEWLGKSNANASTSQPHALSDGLLITKGYGAGLAFFDIARAGKKWEAKMRYQKSRYLKTKLTSVVIRGDHTYGLSDGIMQCVRIKDGKLMWKGGRFGHGQLLCVHDKLIVMSDKGTLTLLAASPRGLEELGQVDALQGKAWNTLCLYGPLLLVRNSSEAACFELPIAPRSPK